MLSGGPFRQSSLEKIFQIFSLRVSTLYQVSGLSRLASAVLLFHFDKKEIKIGSMRDELIIKLVNLTIHFLRLSTGARIARWFSGGLPARVRDLRRNPATEIDQSQFESSKI